jgi:hypothetical protein
VSIDLSEYVSGGYLIVKYGDRARYEIDQSPDLLPKWLVSLSECVAPRLSLTWGWNPEQSRQDLLNFGVSEASFPAFRGWSLQPDANPDGTLPTLAEARRVAQWLTPDTEVLIIGTGLRCELVDDFLTFKPYPDDHPNYEVFESQESVETRQSALQNHPINHRQPLAPGGAALGFEVVSYFGGWGHSWLCSYLERSMYEWFGIRPNQYGLIDTYEQAKQVYEWIAEDRMQGARAEPEPYHPWLIVQYPVSELPGT